MRNLFVLSVLFVSLIILVGCTSAPKAVAANLPTATAVQPPATVVQPTSLPPTPTEVTIPERAPAWTFKTDDTIWSAPVMANGTIYFGSDDHFFYAVNTATHDLVWKFETGDIVRTRPVVANGLVYFGSDDGYLYAMSADKGEQQWRFKVDNESHKRGISEGFAYFDNDLFQSSPALSGQTIYMGSSDGTLYAIDAQSGKEAWHFTTGKKMPIRSTPAVGNGMVYFGDFNGDFYALDASTGQKVWNFNLGNITWIQSEPVLVGGNVIFGAEDAILYALDAKTGQKKWTYTTPLSPYPDFSTPFVADNVIYVNYADDCQHSHELLNAIDVATGQVIWTNSQPIYEGAWGSPAVDKNYVFAGLYADAFYALDRQTGKPVWKVKVARGPVEKGAFAAPVVVDGMVYFGGLDGVLYAVQEQ